MDRHSKELLPAQHLGEWFIAHIYVVEDEPKPGQSGTTFHLDIKVVCTKTSRFMCKETLGPLHGDPMETGLTDDDAEDLAALLKSIGKKLSTNIE